MSERPAEYYVSKAPKPLRGIDYLRKRIQNWFAALTAEGRCYSIGMALLLVAAIVAAFRRPEASLLGQVGAFVFALGLLPLIERLYEWAWRRLLGKLLIAALIALATNLAYGFGRQMVAGMVGTSPGPFSATVNIAALIALATNLAYGFGRQMVAGMVGTSPGPFSATVNIATILIAPILFLMALAIGGIFIFAIALYIGSLALMAVLPSPTPGKRKRVALWICRFVALSIAVFGSMAVLQRTTGYAGWVERRTASYLYTFDMYHDAHYATGKAEKVALLGDGRVLLGSREEDGGHYKFTIQQDGPHGDVPVRTDSQIGQ